MVQDFSIENILMNCLVVIPLIVFISTGYVRAIIFEIKQYEKSKQKDDNSQKRGDKNND